MIRRFRSFRKYRPQLRRVAALAVFAVQGGIATSPLSAAHGERRLAAHAEQDGTRHVNAHNEATCALCSARTQTSMPVEPSPAVARSQLRPALASAMRAAPQRDDARAHQSRAPPSLRA